MAGFPTAGGLAGYFNVGIRNITNIIHAKNNALLLLSIPGSERLLYAKTITNSAKGCPEFNAVEECWRQGKYDLLVSRHYPKFHNLRKTIAKYYRTKRFHLNITKHLLRNMR